MEYKAPFESSIRLAQRFDQHLLFEWTESVVSRPIHFLTGTVLYRRLKIKTICKSNSDTSLKGPQNIFTGFTIACLIDE